MNPSLTCQRPGSPAQLEAYYDFRWEHLRRPWGQAPDSAASEDERRSEHALIQDEAGRIIACGRLVRAAPGVGQLRSMAVAPDRRRTGLGRCVVNTLEDWARGLGLETITIHARTGAEDFYSRCGYTTQGTGDTLFDQIPHVWMEKKLDCADFSRFTLTRRSAKRSDGQAVARLVFDTLATYGMQPEPDGIDRDLEDLPATYAGGFFDLLHDREGQLVASVGMLPLAPGRAELRRMYLHKAYKGRGLGRALLGHALAWAQKNKLKLLELETATSLVEARALYQWAGFRPQEQGHCEARRCDLRMQLAL